MKAAAVKKLRMSYPAVSLALGFFSFMLVLPVLNGHPLIAIDGAMYVGLARAISEGQGYVSAWIAGDPAHVKYPPGFPLLLSSLLTLIGLIPAGGHHHLAHHGLRFLPGGLLLGPGNRPSHADQQDNNDDPTQFHTLHCSSSLYLPIIAENGRSARRVRAKKSPDRNESIRDVPFYPLILLGLVVPPMVVHAIELGLACSGRSSDFPAPHAAFPSMDSGTLGA